MMGGGGGGGGEGDGVEGIKYVHKYEICVSRTCILLRLENLTEVVRKAHRINIQSLFHFPFNNA